MMITVKYPIEGPNGSEVIYDCDVELTEAEPETRDNPGRDADGNVTEIRLLNGTVIDRYAWIHHGFSWPQMDALIEAASERFGELEDEDRATQADVEEARRTGL